MWIAIDYYSHERNCLNGLQIYYKLVEMLRMLERGTNLFNLIEASQDKI